MSTPIPLYRIFEFLDALTFGLFGKAYRNINKPQLVNTINEKGLLVEIEFTIGKKNYIVRRGVKPNLFEIHLNGKLIDQLANNRDYQDYLVWVAEGNTIEEAD